VILVATGGGLFGSRLLRLLIAADVPVRALAHSRHTADELEALGADVVVADLDDPATVAPALGDADQLFLSTPMHPALARRETSLLDLAARAGVRHVVKISGAARRGGHPLTRSHAEVATALRSSGLAWTLLSPSLTMETALLPQLDDVRRTGILWGAAGDGRVALMGADDVARAAMVVLAEPGFDGTDVELTGPEALSFPELAERLGPALGTTVRYRDVDESQLAGHLLAAGVPAARIDLEALVYFAAIRDGGAGHVTGEVERLTGSRPVPLERFLSARAGV
jgi:uncharacterized protein YbjT (DUF2867 family)